ncbi:MAG: tyrosine-type recombinase/integrase [Clostridiales bacterium]|nr:tyrosine-type recombinase/integrase [Clostridiales bacterium]
MYIDVIKNRSQKTVFEYSLNLKEFISFILIDRNICTKENVDLRICDENFFKSVTLNDAYKFLSYCKNDKENSASTRARKVVAIRQFFKYLADNRQILRENPMKNLDTPKQQKTLPKYLTLEQSIDLLNSVDGKNKERDYAILTLFLNCGLRLSELVELNYTDIRSDNSMRIFGKGSKERVVYLNNACIDAIKAYMEVRPKDGVIDKEALFLSNRRKRISSKTVQHIVYEFLDKSGLSDRGLSVHKLRHTAATLMYQYGNADVLVLKDILGHENLSTTEIYTHLVDEQKKDAVESNPLANISKKNEKNG